MAGEILFISDLHLSPEQPETGRLFLRFLREQGKGIESLYILGDLFEVWLGDDAILPAYQPFLEALRDLGERGVSLHVMRGNRDFLMGESFASLTGATLLEDPTAVSLGGIPTLLMHGDLLCTDDVAYQEFRAMVHDPAWQRALLGKSMEERLNMARQLREESRSATRGKSAEIMDVNQETVEQFLREFGASQLIHGHTHRPAEHRFTLDGHPVTRFVLPEWSSRRGGGALRLRQGELRFESYANPRVSPGR